MTIAALDPTHVVFSGSLAVAAVLALAAGAISFLSPCCLPLVPGFLSLIAGTAGMEVSAVPSTGAGTPLDTRVRGGRTLLAGGLFVAGFSAVFVSYGAAFGGLGAALGRNQGSLVRVLGAVTVLLGLSFAGVLRGLPFVQRTVRIRHRPRAGLIGAPLLGAVFGLGWTPCIGPTLAAVLTLAVDQSSASRGAFLALVYSVGLGLPFMVAGVLFARGLAGFGWARRNAGLVMRTGGVLLVVIGILQLTGGWTLAVNHLRGWIGGYNAWL